MRPNVTANPPPPPPLEVVRAAVATRGRKLISCILPMAEANAAAVALGGCIGCLTGDKLAIALVHEADDRVVALAVCSSPAAEDLADPHTLEVRCLLVDSHWNLQPEALWSAMEQKAAQRGYRRLVMRGAGATPPAAGGAGWVRLRACGIWRCDRSVAQGALWAKVLRGERH
jgi:hypothetical protein